jgi:hypothetical protein
MLAVIYLGLAIYLGDQICRRFYRFVSLAHRCSAAVLVGLLASSWFTYLVAWIFKSSRSPLFWADLCFLVTAIGAIWLFKRRRPGSSGNDIPVTPAHPPGSALWDWVTLAAYLVLASWMMFATLDYKNGTLLIGNNEWSDFGPNTAIIQSFAIGHNFPTQYPHFSGETIRYHFLFYFQAGNLTFLGLNLNWSLNLLSIVTLVCMLALVMTLGQVLFNSRTVGRIGSAFFFFHGTLSFIPFLRSQPSLTAALHSIVTLKDFLPSGYPYRGELWGIWTQVVFLNQRHLASGVGILLLVLIFLIHRYRQHAAAKETPVAQVATDETLVSQDPDTLPVTTDLSVSIVESQADAPLSETASMSESQAPPGKPFLLRVRDLTRRVVVFDRGFVFSGFLLGALPFWNALVFTASFAVLFVLFLLFPCRRQMLGMGLATAVAALPQLFILRSGGVKTPTHSLLHWGYIVEPPTINNVLRYIGFSFGLKWLLILVALALVSWFHRRLFLALCSLFFVTFCLQLSLETLANHKYLNLWLIVGNLFAAYGLWRLWHMRPRWLQPVGRLVALLLALAIVLGGIIDLFPIHNSYFIQLKYGNDPLVKWVRSNTRPHDVFLSDRFVNHQILLAGRRLFYGWPSFSWGAGYDTTKRDDVYRQLFESTDPYAVFRLLRENKIAYVAIDEGVRRGEFIKRPNEEVYSLNFEKVWEDKANVARYLQSPGGSSQRIETAGPRPPSSPADANSAGYHVSRRQRRGKRTVRFSPRNDGGWFRKHPGLGYEQRAYPEVFPVRRLPQYVWQDRQKRRRAPGTQRDCGGSQR